MSALVSSSGANTANYEYGPDFPVRENRSGTTTACSSRLYVSSVNSEERSLSWGEGEVIRESGVMAKINPFRFSTKYQDSESDLLYYGYRYYNPTAGRWLSRDSIGELGALSLYGFVENDPIQGVDHLGNFTLVEFIVVAAVVTGVSYLVVCAVKKGQASAKRSTALRVVQEDWADKKGNPQGTITLKNKQPNIEQNVVDVLTSGYSLDTYTVTLSYATTTGGKKVRITLFADVTATNECCGSANGKTIDEWYVDRAQLP